MSWGFRRRRFATTGRDWLEVHGGYGGPAALSQESYYPGSNDALGGDPTGEEFNPSAFSLYSAWEQGDGHGYGDDQAKARAEIAAGEARHSMDEDLWI